MRKLSWSKSHFQCPTQFLLPQKESSSSITLSFAPLQPLAQGLCSYHFLGVYFFSITAIF